MKENMKEGEKVKDSIKVKIANGFKQGVIRYQEWKAKNFIRSSTFMYWVGLLLIALLISSHVADIVKPNWLAYVIVIGIGGLIGLVVKLILGWLQILFLKEKLEEWVSALLIIGAIVGGVGYIAFNMNDFPTKTIGILVGLLFILFLKCVWSLLVGKLHTKFNISVSLIGIVALSLLVGFLNSEGFEDTYIKTYLQLEKTASKLSAEEKNSFKQSIMEGNYTVLTATYDTHQADIQSKTVDLTSYASNKGLLGYVKEKYQGYGLNEVPIRGKVWYPKEASNCPTLFMIHGNHNYTEESYLGYEYLGQYLASCGYVMVSVDQNACNLLNNENDARAILLLENMKALMSYNEDRANPIYQKIDDSQLAIAGHSRGGEVVGIAYLFNHLEENPNNGKMKLNYHFDIQSLIAIAPTVDQYQPTNKDVSLEDVNYLVIHGANDQDVNQFSGIKQYKNIHFTGKGNYIKTALYCAGCNHGQFNSRWGLYDREGFYSKVLNVKNFVSEKDQETIAGIFIKIFLDCTLRGDTRHIGLFEDYRDYTEYLPKTLYVQSYQKSDFKVLCNFEEDTMLSSGTREDVSIDVQSGSVWTEGLYPSEASQSNSAVYLQWKSKKTPTFKVSMHQTDMTNRTVQFDIMNLEEGFKEEEASLLKANIVLEDANGETAEVELSDYATIYPAFLVRLNKFQYLLGDTEYKHQFQTVSIPTSAFSKGNSRMQLNQIVSLKIRFTDEFGTVAIDEIGY